MEHSYLLLFSILTFSFQDKEIIAQQKISRLADLGKIWGILHNFHPSMAKGFISTDSLVLMLLQAWPMIRQQVILKPA
jgi:hypothetical protein